MHITFFVEEPSAEVLIRHLAPKLLREDDSFECIRFRGKHAMMKKLPERLRTYARWLPDDHRLVVLVDRDRQACQELKKQLEIMAKKAGLTSLSRASRQRTAQIATRIAVEELEAWYLGDIEALRATYPRIPSSLGKRKQFRDPDAITGGTWEALERELQKSGYHEGGLQKLKAADDIGPHLEPSRSQSASFRCFCQGVQRLVARKPL